MPIPVGSIDELLTIVLGITAFISRKLETEALIGRSRF